MIGSYGLEERKVSIQRFGEFAWWIGEKSFLLKSIQKAFFPCYFYLDFLCLQLLNNQLLQKQSTKNSWNGVKFGLQNLLEWCNFVGV